MPEAIICKRKGWTITRSGKRSGWLLPELKNFRRSQSWIRYDDGGLGFDFPEAVPQWIKNFLGGNS